MTRYVLRYTGAGPVPADDLTQVKARARVVDADGRTLLVEAPRGRVTALVAPTHQEEGCVQYDLHESTDQPGRFVFYENWTSRAALDKHSASAHIQAFRAKASEVLAEPARVLTYTRIA